MKSLILFQAICLIFYLNPQFPSPFTSTVVKMAFGVFSTTPFMDLKTSEQNTVVEFLKKVNGLE